jgi:phage replication O-like protein O
MAAPQTEDGYLKIADELVEALAKTNLSAHESRVMWCIFRKTYGWKKKLDWIAASQFKKITGLDRRHTFRALEKLAKRRIIVIHTDDKNRRSYGIQKNYDRWILSSKQMTSSRQMTHLSSKEAHTKDTITKDTIRRSPKVSRLGTPLKEKSPVGGYKETVALYFELFALRFGGAKPDFDGADGNLLSGLIAKHGAGQVQTLLRLFFERPPPWVLKDLRFTIPAFKRSFTELIAQFQNGRIQHSGGFIG